MGVGGQPHAPASEQYQVNNTKGSGIKEICLQTQQVKQYNDVLNALGSSDSSSGIFITKA